eukprot:CAMPEP_0197242912 /NCGR_PEP_ID=MMETSP1429-20130617/8514_1 /TAXON_ID=49237 /ORGANISM="Chaetoceros  sp., Strain UNC1202" /LENGTH=366 /DNA_ID=CAMNT_0042703033 /DNA_START=52 /DNA_END=1152 /DNA_ORIENTATION=-
MGRIRSGNFGGMLRHCQHQPGPSSNTLSSILSVNRTHFSPASSSSIEPTPITVAYNLAYTIENPKYLSHSYRKKPLIILHGGPGIPSDYLYPISKHIKDRAVIYYDQIGCGKSSEPSDIKAYSIENSVNDLEQLIRHLNLKSFHLLGHSFGGIIAYELVKRGLKVAPQSEVTGNADMSCAMGTPSIFRTRKCLSLTLSSTPFNVRQVDEESERLRQTMESENETSALTSFQKIHVCRTPDTPRPLQEAFSKRGRVWHGTEVIHYYVAQDPDTADDAANNGAETSTCSNIPAIFLTRGEFDFVSARHSQESWKELFEHASAGTACCKTSTLAGCAHYGMLEDGAQYARTLESFLSECGGEEPQCQSQ